MITWPDMRTDYGEARINAIGEADGKVPCVVFTLRGEVIRIITAWRANRKDRQTWQTRR